MRPFRSRPRKGWPRLAFLLPAIALVEQPGLLQQLDRCGFRRVRALSADRRRLRTELLLNGEIAVVKSQVPSSKSQRTSNCQLPNQHPTQAIDRSLEIGGWEFIGIWSLALGI